MASTLAERIIAFNKSLDCAEILPKGIRVMNPYKENDVALASSSTFYYKYFNDNNKRRLILGINPGRMGAGITGIPFTDSFRLEEYCDIKIDGIETRELSSIFVYNVIEALGGAKAFYSKYLMSSISPLGFVKLNDKGKELNYNYYDDADLQNALEPFIVRTLNQQIQLGIDCSVCYCLGQGKNYKYLLNLNAEKQFFEKIVPLEHPRYLMQYKLKSIDDYIAKFVNFLK